MRMGRILLGRPEITIWYHIRSFGHLNEKYTQTNACDTESLFWFDPKERDP